MIPRHLVPHPIAAIAVTWPPQESVFVPVRIGTGKLLWGELIHLSRPALRDGVLRYLSIVRFGDKVGTVELKASIDNLYVERTRDNV